MTAKAEQMKKIYIVLYSTRWMVVSKCGGEFFVAEEFFQKNWRFLCSECEANMEQSQPHTVTYLHDSVVDGDEGEEEIGVSCEEDEQVESLCLEWDVSCIFDLDQFVEQEGNAGQVE